MMVAKVIMAHHLPMWIEYPLILSLVYALRMSIYHVAIQPFPFVRFLFGLKRDTVGRLGNRWGKWPEPQDNPRQFPARSGESAILTAWRPHRRSCTAHGQDHI